MKYMHEHNITNISIKTPLKDRGEGMSRPMFVNSYR